MIERYNPHFIQKQSFPWLPPKISTSLEEDVISRADAIWAGTSPFFLPFLENSEILPEFLNEYGIDAVRVASLSQPGNASDSDLLEAAFKWLASIHDYVGEGNIRRKDNEWRPQIWLWAAFSSRDHLLKRGRVYPALAALRKAWKISPVTDFTPAAGKKLAYLLLTPFAPVLGMFLWQKFFPGEIPEKLENIAASFFPLQAVRFGIERSGWKWEVVNYPEFRENPARYVLNFGWVARALAGKETWDLRQIEEGWKICLNLPHKKNDSSLT